MRAPGGVRGGGGDRRPFKKSRGNQGALLQLGSHLAEVQPLALPQSTTEGCTQKTRAARKGHVSHRCAIILFESTI